MSTDSAGASAETATFVFADLAGYTALTEAHGDEYAADTAAAFGASIRALLVDYDAQEIKTIGDALMLRATDATQALHLAARIVEDLGAQDRTLALIVR
jgi:adenylate cyclase